VIDYNNARRKPEIMSVLVQENTQRKRYGYMPFSEWDYIP